MLLLLIACDPLGPGVGVPPDWRPPIGQGELRLERDTVDFGSLSVLTDDPVSRTVMVTNTGNAELDISGLSWLIGDTDAFSVDAPALVTLQPEQTTPITLTFAPPAHGEFEAALFPNGQRILRMLGTATAPQVSVKVQEDDLGVVPVGCEAETSVVVENVGSELLILHDVHLEGTPDHTLEGAPAVLEPGELSVLSLGLLPATPGAAAARVVVDSNDPAGERGVQVDALATSAGSVTEDFIWLPPSEADVLFVLDGQTAGTGLLDEAQLYAEVLFERLNTGNVDWRISAVDGQDCHATFDPWLDSGVYSPTQAGPALGLALTGGGDRSDLLNLAVEALDDAATGGCLEGFRRPEAQLHVVLVGHRPDGSSMGLQDLQTFSESVLVSAIVGEGSNGCALAGGPIEAAEASGGLVADLCAGDWDTVYESVAELSWGNGEHGQALKLDRPPAVNTLEVEAEGKTLTAWRWEEERLWLDGDAEQLELFDSVSVSYEIAQSCE